MPLVRSTGLEPARILLHSDLNATCLPVPPRPRYRIYYTVPLFFCQVLFNVFFRFIQFEKVLLIT